MFSLLLALACGACGRTVTKDAPHDSYTARHDASGTTTFQAKAERDTDDVAAAPEPAKPQVPLEAEVKEEPVAASKDEKSAPPPPAAPAASAADSYGAGGLGLSGIGAGGGGYGTGHGRLSGSHATARKSMMAMRPRAAATSAAPAVRAGSAYAPSKPLAPVAPVTKSPPEAPEQEFNTEAYHKVTENPFLNVKDSPLSTFSVDVDTASYSNMRRFVSEGQRPPADSIRVEEWVNYFSYDDVKPVQSEPVAVSSEVTDCPWAPGHRLLRVALNTQPIAQDAVPPRNIVFLVDVSGSMEDANKLPLLKRGLALLARQLRPQDTVSIAVYAGASGLALPPTSGADQGKILGVLGNLEAGGSTNGGAGIQLAYDIATHQFKKGGINRVILASDGDFNVGTTSEGELERLIEEKRKTGVFLTVLGFGEGNLKDATMEKLADKGNGQYAYVDSLAEARKVLVHQAGATLVTVAKDVKLQLEFNPSRVKSYRLVGYENRLLADRDFNDDTKDAGEMGAGHHVTAFYEIVPADGTTAQPATAIDPLKYQNERTASPAAQSGDLVTVKIRYKPPAGDKSLLMTSVVPDRVVPLPSTSDSLRFGAAVAYYALGLRGAEGVTLSHVETARSLAAGALGQDPRGERREFLALMDRATHLPKK